jgi:MFS family permease
MIFCALAGLAVVLGIWALRLEDAPPSEQPSAATIARAFRNRHFVGGLALMALASLLFGILSVLGPLHLSAAGWGAAAIGAVWLVGAALETVQAPLVGRLMDRRGVLLPVRAALVVGTIVSLGLAAGGRPLVYVPCIVLAAMSYGVLFTPAFALIAEGAERVSLAQGMAFGVMNAAWALGAVTGPAAGGAIANATGDWIPFVLAAALCTTALLCTRVRSEHERAAVLVDRLPGDPAGAGRK